MAFLGGMTSETTTLMWPTNNASVATERNSDNERKRRGSEGNVPLARRAGWLLLLLPSVTGDLAGPTFARVALEQGLDGAYASQTILPGRPVIIWSLEVAWPNNVTLIVPPFPMDEGSLKSVLCWLCRYCWPHQASLPGIKNTKHLLNKEAYLRTLPVVCLVLGQKKPSV